MEFLILALLGLATFGVTESLSSGDSESDKSDKKDGDKKDGDKKDGDKKSPEQELMEAIAKYEANPPKDKRVKISFEVQDRE